MARRMMSAMPWTPVIRSCGRACTTINAWTMIGDAEQRQRAMQCGGQRVPPPAGDERAVHARSCEAEAHAASLIKGRAPCRAATASRGRSNAIRPSRMPDDAVGVAITPDRPDAARTARRALRCASFCNSRMMSSRGLRIEAGDRLIGQQHPRPLRQCPRDRHALRLAARQACRRAARQDAASPTLREIRRARPDLWSRQAAKRGPPRLMPAQRAAATLASTLRRRTKFACCQIMARTSRARRSASPVSGAGSVPSSQTSPAVGVSAAGDAAQQRGLAAAVAAEHDRQLARVRPPDSTSLSASLPFG